MKTLVLYATKRGCTERCANELAKKLDGEVTVYNIKNGKIKELESYDKIVIGSSIYAGMLRKEIKAFCNDNQELLKQKKTGYFICGMSEGEDAVKLLNTVYNQELLAHAVAKASFGGEIVLDKMGFFERAIIKKVAKLENDMTNVSDDAISKFALEFNNA